MARKTDSEKVLNWGFWLLIACPALVLIGFLMAVPGMMESYPDAGRIIGGWCILGLGCAAGNVGFFLLLFGWIGTKIDKGFRKLNEAAAEAGQKAKSEAA